MNTTGLYEALDTIKEQLLSGSMDNFMKLSMLIAGLGAIFYVSYRVWRSMASAEPVDIFPLLKPLVLGFFIITFDVTVLPFIDGIVGAIGSEIDKISQEDRQNLESLRKERDAQRDANAKKSNNAESQVQPGINVANGDPAPIIDKDRGGFWGNFNLTGKLTDWFCDLLQWVAEAVQILLTVLSTFIQIILAFIGPLVFAFACWDGFGSGVTAWISRYASISLWGPVSALLALVLNRVEFVMLNVDLAVLRGEDAPDGSSWYLIIFYIVGICAFLCVPTISGWIIEAGSGAGALGRTVQSLGSGAMSAAGGAFGAAAGGALAVAGQKYAGSRGADLLPSVMGHKKTAAAIKGVRALRTARQNHKAFRAKDADAQNDNGDDNS